MRCFSISSSGVGRADEWLSSMLSPQVTTLARFDMYVANLMEFKQDPDHCASHFVCYVDASGHISGVGNQQNKDTSHCHDVTDLRAYRTKESQPNKTYHLRNMLFP